MYLGGGQIIQAPQTGEDVQVDPADLATVIVATCPAWPGRTSITRTPRNPSSGGIPMTSRPPAPPLPKPQHPAVAARAVSDAAHIAAYIWARPLDPARHGRAISQLYSTLRDLGIATRGLARYRMTDVPAGPVSRDFPQYVDASARWLLNTCESLDGVLAAESTGSLPDPDEPGAVLCQAARNAILAWRQPSGTSTDRDLTIKRFITATGFLSSAALGLAAYAPRRRATDLQAVCVGTRRSHRLPDDGRPGVRRGCLTRIWRGAGPAPGGREQAAGQPRPSELQHRLTGNIAWPRTRFSPNAPPGSTRSPRSRRS